MSTDLIFRIDGVEVKEMDVDRAFRLVSGGLAQLASVQSEPPLEFLSHFIKELDKLDSSVCGPPLVEPGLLEEMDTQLFLDGARRRALNRKCIQWLESESEVKEALIDHLFPDAHPSVWKQLTGTLAAARARAPKARRNNSVPRPSLDTNWRNFSDRLSVASELLWFHVEAAMQERRLVCIATGGNRDHYWTPRRGQRLALLMRSGKVVMAFSSHIRSVLSPSVNHADLAVRKGEAARQMQMNYRHFVEQGREPTGQDLMLWARREFGLSENAAKDAWSKVVEKVGRRGGRPKTRNRVEISEFKRLE